MRVQARDLLKINVIVYAARCSLLAQVYRNKLNEMIHSLTVQPVRVKLFTLSIIITTHSNINLEYFFV